MSESELEQEWIAGGAHESFVSWLCLHLDAERLHAAGATQRGDTYRRRAMALLQLTRVDHKTSVSIIQKQDFEIAILRGELDKAKRHNRTLDEALNSGDGVYRP